MSGLVAFTLQQCLKHQNTCLEKDYIVLRHAEILTSKLRQRHRNRTVVNVSMTLANMDGTIVKKEVNLLSVNNKRTLEEQNIFT